jgi:mannose-6-phosphate isomerase
LKRYVWGGRKLGSMLGKPLGEGADYAESWEVCDHGQDQSMVAFGPLAGQTLGSLVHEHGPELLGRHFPQRQFPLLFKFIDARDRLSVQVHPDDARAAQLIPPDLGKTEAWVVLDAEPGSIVYAGLKRGFDRPALAREVARGTCELCLSRIEPRVGDCIYLPAGVLHALGAGLLIAEIQQSSNTTFRLYDWNRLGLDGKPRPLHIEQALDCTNYSYGPVRPQVPRPTDTPGAARLVACDKFVLDRWELHGPRALGGDERFHIVAVLEGQATLEHDPSGQPLRRGDTALVPAGVGRIQLTPNETAVVLDACLP